MAARARHRRRRHLELRARPPQGPRLRRGAAAERSIASSGAADAQLGARRAGRPRLPPARHPRDAPVPPDGSRRAGLDPGPAGHRHGRRRQRRAVGSRPPRRRGRRAATAPAAPGRGPAGRGFDAAGRDLRRPLGRRRGRRAGDAPPPRTGRRRHGHVHLRQHRHPEGRRLLARQPGQQALRARGRPAAGRPGRGSALLPAALPHLRPLPGAARHDVLGRRVRLRREPVARDAAAPAAAGPPHRPDRRPPALEPAARGLPGGARRRGRRALRRGRARDDRGPLALGPVRRRPPRARGLPLLPPPRHRAVQRLRHDRGHRRHHDDAARRLPRRLGGPAPARGAGALRRGERAGDLGALRRRLPRRWGAARRRRLAAHRRHLPPARRRPPRDHRPPQGHLQERPRADRRPAARRAEVRRRARHPARLPGRGPPHRQRAADRSRPRGPRPAGGTAGRGRPRLLRADRPRRQRRPALLRARRQLRGAGPRLRRRPRRADAQGLLPPQGHRGELRRRRRRAVPQRRGHPGADRRAPARAALADPRTGPPRDRPGGRRRPRA